MRIDYWKLNSITVKDRYPLPRIKDQLDKLHVQIYFTSLNLKSEYHQIQGSKQFPAFVTAFGQFEFKSLPFELANAPSAFQRLVNKVLLPSLDDILLSSKPIDEGLSNLEEVLQLLRQEGLTLNLKKRTFVMQKVTYLGIEISEGKVRPNDLKTKARKDFPTPTSVHYIR